MDFQIATQLITDALRANGSMTAQELASEVGIKTRLAVSALLSLRHRNLVFVSAIKPTECGRQINVYSVFYPTVEPQRKRRRKLSTHRVRPPLPSDCNVLGIWTQLLKPHERPFFTRSIAPH